jgi:putative membrane protein
MMMSHRPPRRRFVAAAVIALAAMAAGTGVASAHGTALQPHDAATSWATHPLVLIPLILTAAVYARGVARVWKRAGFDHGVRAWQASAFAAGMLALFVALVSPLDAMAESLFSAHMAQHLLLMLVAAPLLMLGAPGVAFGWGLPRATSRSIHTWASYPEYRAIAAAARQPLVVWTAFAVVFWLWHLPPLYDAALRNDAIHAAEHASFLATALMFWSLVVRRSGKRDFEYGASAAFVFTAMLQTSVLAALLTFSGTVWYPGYAGAAASSWGLTPIQDQRLAGLIMWIPSNGIFLVATLTLVGLWVRDDERRIDEASPSETARRDALAGAPRVRGVQVD